MLCLLLQYALYILTNGAGEGLKRNTISFALRGQLPLGATSRRLSLRRRIGNNNSKNNKQTKLLVIFYRTKKCRCALDGEKHKTLDPKVAQRSRRSDVVGMGDIGEVGVGDMKGGKCRGYIAGLESLSAKICRRSLTR